MIPDDILYRCGDFDWYLGFGEFLDMPLYLY
ncbi:hypothetical protein Goklo_007379 [Gossypium klotzschianum]|uniref:Uncharacterized protein n=1 Tax=Gossypium klotzschianum TaxID=34286 RepID=A0A7J8WAH5_9ROSI|nr:hypothetical protein [Gossypium klotzschianum]